AFRRNIAALPTSSRWTFLQRRESWRRAKALALSRSLPRVEFSAAASVMAASMIFACNLPAGARPQSPTFTDTRLALPPQFQAIAGTPQRLVKNNFILSQAPD